MSSRFWIWCLLLCGVCGQPAWAGDTVAEQAAQVYADHELASHARHANLPDYSLPAGKLAAAQRLARIEERLHLADLAWDIVSLGLLLSLGGIAAMRDLAVRPSANRWLQGFSFLFQYMAATWLLGLPLEAYGHHVSRSYGFSVQGWGSWFGDQAKLYGLVFPFLGLLVMLLFWTIRKLPRTWWLACWAMLCGVIVLSFYGTPYATQLFYTYQPLQATNPALVAQLERVVARGHMDIPPGRMYLMKASAKTTTLNADVEGFGASKRVVVWDTTIAKATPDEITFIFGHESGHYVLGHLTEGLIGSMAGALVTLYLAFLFLRWSLPRFGCAWRIPSQGDWGSLAVLALAASLISTVSEPLASALIRQREHAADVYGQEAIHGIVANPQAAAQQAFDVLGETSLDDPNPNPLYVFWTYSHPPIGFRAAFAHAYDPWAPGASPRYVPAH